jgi:hypothetical protein
MSNSMVKSAKAHLFKTTLEWYHTKLERIRTNECDEDAKLRAAVAVYVENLVAADNEEEGIE